ncbi:MAG: FkbM family methyltransferase [Flavobacteriaceae bacterium]|nr:FkbM family methyltransferase [Flavobacteriaceae bacterium]
MKLNTLPQNIAKHLISACSLLGIRQEKIGFWEVSDYGIFVLLTESFYQTLNYRKAEPSDFITRRELNDLPHSGHYRDSRSYMSIVIQHFLEHGLTPNIIDIGGYIGRFSIETALLLQSEKLPIDQIYCLEPGLTMDIIKANLELNGVNSLVTLEAWAASDEESTAEYKYAPHVLISGRISPFPSATKFRTVKTRRLNDFLNELPCKDAAIIKIDTEGHEPNVMMGLGQLVHTLPNVCIVEFWPQSLNQSVNGIKYADFLKTNYHLINIRSSLYPNEFTLETDIQEFANKFDFEQGNVDLLFIGKSVPNCNDLVNSILSMHQ